MVFRTASTLIFILILLIINYYYYYYDWKQKTIGSTMETKKLHALNLMKKKQKKII